MENKLKSTTGIRFPSNNRNNNKQVYQAYKTNNDALKYHQQQLNLPFPVGNNGFGGGIGLYAPNDIGKNILQNYHIMQDHV